MGGGGGLRNLRVQNSLYKCKVERDTLCFLKLSHNIIVNYLSHVHRVICLSIIQLLRGERICRNLPHYVLFKRNGRLICRRLVNNRYLKQTPPVPEPLADSHGSRAPSLNQSEKFPRGRVACSRSSGRVARVVAPGMTEEARTRTRADDGGIPEIVSSCCTAPILSAAINIATEARRARRDDHRDVLAILPPRSEPTRRVSSELRGTRSGRGWLAR